MTNQEIARSFQLLGKLMELHGDNPFKIRSYSNAYMKLRKLEKPLAEMSTEEIVALPGVGKAIQGKIAELTTNGRMATLDKWLDQTPAGVVEMLSISGFGPKKVKAVWKGLGVESIGELLYAVNENRLVELKGFGAKTQADLKKKLEFVQRSSGQFHYRTLEQLAKQLFGELRSQLGRDFRCEASGAIRRRAQTLTAIELITDLEEDQLGQFDKLEGLETVAAGWKAIYHDVPVYFYRANAHNWGSIQFAQTASAKYLESIEDVGYRNVSPGSSVDSNAEAELGEMAKIEAVHHKLGALETEEACFRALNMANVPPELREADWRIGENLKDHLSNLVTEEDIKGVVHSHTTYSDGINSLKEMAEASRDLGYEYILITDHSQSAFYANGLKEDRLIEQWVEIDALNVELAPFRILKGIESDILNDGSLDYPDEVLGRFDLIIASVHSNLRMDKEKATQRLLTAIKNPYTNILGHPTGRLLLSREGYPIDHAVVIDACAEHGVCIELNAHPWRLDLDWTWIAYATEKGVPISINPDAHSVGGIKDIRYGVLAARKGGLLRNNCLNTLGVDNFLKWFGKA